MLKTFAVALLATAMSVGLAEAKGHMAKPKAPAPCQTEQQAAAKCACGPAKNVCQKGQWCHAFVSACTQ
jgi:hypothetical protein